jgi:nicotinate-nucleotide adenylyltransferase
MVVVTAPVHQASHCVAVLGGSFDPVHNGHVALAKYFVNTLTPHVLRVIPAGNPWQKHGLQATPAQRMDMVNLAFKPLETATMPVMIDQQEIRRKSATYTIDTLKLLRQELGNTVSIIFLMGADQLQHLNTWQNWRELFDYAHLCAASRPGYDLALSQIPTEVMQEFTLRSGTPLQIRSTSHGLGYLASDLAVDISSTDIRSKLQLGHKPEDLLPQAVLDYIEQHHLYQGKP